MQLKTGKVAKSLGTDERNLKAMRNICDWVIPWVGLLFKASHVKLSETSS